MRRLLLILFIAFLSESRPVVGIFHYSLPFSRVRFQEVQKFPPVNQMQDEKNSGISNSLENRVLTDAIDECIGFGWKLIIKFKLMTKNWTKDEEALEKNEGEEVKELIDELGVDEKKPSMTLPNEIMVMESKPEGRRRYPRQNQNTMAVNFTNA